MHYISALNGLDSKGALWHCERGQQVAVLELPPGQSALSQAA